jgi:hypothetical protein
MLLVQVFVYGIGGLLLHFFMEEEEQQEKTFFFFINGQQNIHQYHGTLFQRK